MDYYFQHNANVWVIVDRSQRFTVRRDVIFAELDLKKSLKKRNI